MEPLKVIFIISVIVIIVAIFAMISNRNDREKAFKSALSTIQGVTTGPYYVSHSGDSSIATNHDFSNISLSITIRGIPSHKVFPSYDILSSEIIEDGQSITKTVRSSQIGGAIVGGLMPG